MFGLFKERNEKKSLKAFSYDKFPEKLRVQIQFIVIDILNGIDNGYYKVHKLLCEEYGKISLSSRNVLGRSDRESILDVINNEKDVGIILDIIELSLRFKFYFFKDKYDDINKVKIEFDKLVNKINIRFMESSIGYQYVNGKFIKMDSEYAFSEIIENVLNLTRNKFFSNVNSEFNNALTEYKKNNNDLCLLKCNNAFESTMKIICSKNGWKFDDGDTAGTLINICFNNDLILKEMKSEFTSLNSLLSSGMPPIRNKYAAHGQGIKKKDIPDHLAMYALNITGSCILFLIENNDYNN